MAPERRQGAQRPQAAHHRAGGAPPEACQAAELRAAALPEECLGGNRPAAVRREALAAGLAGKVGTCVDCRPGSAGLAKLSAIWPTRPISGSRDPP